MGGNALTPFIASRLTTSQLNSLLLHARKSLEGYFNPIEIPRFLVDKVEHGDLDLLCGTDDVRLIESLKGIMERGSINDHQHDHESPHVESDNYQVESDKERQSPRAWCGSVCKALHGTMWKRNSAEIHIGVPASIIGSTLSPVDGYEPFYQIDLILLPRYQVPFARLALSFAITPMLLALILRSISRSLTLHRAEIVLRHAPFVGVPGIDIALTSDPRAFCDWLGLNYTTWLETEFTHEHDLWEWLVDTEPDSLAGGALKRLGTEWETIKLNPEIARARKRAKGGPSASARFIDWLKRPESNWYSPSPIPTAVPATQPQSEEHAIPTTPETITSSSETSTPNNLIDPDHPKQLSDRAKAAVVFWGKLEEYEKELASRLVTARELASNQRRRIEARHRKEEEERNLKQLTQTISAVSVVDPEV
ncbi:hypothetical protein BCR39DRAFT_554683 [Naematelia encephala]|uniref:Uncharacterized protein n=1 Tax=Naematelia encephala TaxID=71784 RepID=A0A1Y2AE25_9TREE|nr:hypothetical protein BCR39DRAFT_554683 [Naematelia encephala]